jgi:hypothetical protein
LRYRGQTSANIGGFLLVDGDIRDPVQDPLDLIVGSGPLDLEVRSGPVRDPLDPSSDYSDCNRAYTFGYEYACRARIRQTIVKHDKICQALATALRANLDNKVFLEPRGDYRDILIDIRIDNPKGTLHLDVSVISLTKEKARKDLYDTLTSTEQTKKNKYRVLGQAFKPFILS